MRDNTVYTFIDHEKIFLFHENILKENTILNKAFTIKKSTVHKRVKITEKLNISFEQFNV